MKDINTGVFLLVLGLILLVAGIFAPIYSIEIRWLLGILSMSSIYTSYAMITTKHRRQKNFSFPNSSNKLKNNY